MGDVVTDTVSFMRRFLAATPYERYLMWLLVNRIADIDRRRRDRAV